MTEGRRFPAPWTVEEYRGISYIVRDANNFAVAYVYFASESGHTRYLMTKDEARTVAATAEGGLRLGFALELSLKAPDLTLNETRPVKPNPVLQLTFKN
jgi:hypothetical protein